GTGRITFNNQLQNIGQEDTRGVDLSLNYKFEVAGLDWSTSLDTTFLTESSVVDADGNIIDYVGNITASGGGYADVKSNLTIMALGDDWNASYKARYISGMDSFSCLDDPSGCYAPTTPSMVYHDINAAYMMTEIVTLSGGVNNLFDNEPPYYTGNNDSNTDPYTYDVLGRYFYVNVNVKF
ncbi:MAG: TonB-dependent receptor, partial [Colwellia sp.]|uniref:TonB-dependent receptor domain-containing protein n=1 Tax=Colwellia sp. TaxID=56799 RepID=UPI001DE61F0D